MFNHAAAMQGLTTTSYRSGSRSNDNDYEVRKMRKNLRLVTCVTLLGIPGLITCGGPSDQVDQPANSIIDVAGFNTAVRPQDDFYEYVNGGWLAKTEIPDDKRMVGMLDTMGSQAATSIRNMIEKLATTETEEGSDEQLVADFFRSYMDSDRVESLGTAPVRDLLQAIRQTETIDDLLELGVRMNREGVASPLWVKVAADFADSTRYTAELHQGGITLQGPEFYFAEDAHSQSIQQAMPGYVATLFEYAGLEEPAARGKAVFDLETKLAASLQPVAELRDLGGYNPYPVADLAQLSADIDWEGFLAAAGLAGQQRIVVRSPPFVARLGALLRQEPLETWKDYWTFRVLNDNADLLPQEFVKARFDFLFRVARGITEMRPRSARASQRVEEDLNWPVAKLYVTAHFDPATKDRMLEIVDDLRKAFSRAIETADWMGDETKLKAQEKLRKVTARIGYPDVWPDNSGLQIRSEDLVGNARRASAHRYDASIRRLSQPVDSSEWFESPNWLVGAYDLTSNAIEFSAPLLQPPLFVLGADDAYNYAGIGQVIGHELGHGFDDEGRKFDGDGNLKEWCLEEESAVYQARANRLVEYYNGFEPLQGLHVNGQLTLGENLSDLTALVLGYNAYLQSLDGKEPPIVGGFTGEQRFFLSFAQVWRNKLRDETLRQWLLSAPQSPPEVRVNGPLKHFSKFYEAFDLKKGDGMWLDPEQRVTIW